jgi:hypothetical protein
MEAPQAQSQSASADVIAQVNGQLEAARIAAKSARTQTKWTVVAGIVVALITGIATYLGT